VALVVIAQAAGVAIALTQWSASRPHHDEVVV
jgi:hypothetical protein